MRYLSDGDLTFGELFDQIAATRARYEALRTYHGSLDERARLVSRLHSLRAQMAELRNSGI